MAKICLWYHLLFFIPSHNVQMQFALQVPIQIIIIIIIIIIFIIFVYLQKWQNASVNHLDSVTRRRQIQLWISSSQLTCSIVQPTAAPSGGMWQTADWAEVFDSQCLRMTSRTSHPSLLSLHTRRQLSSLKPFRRRQVWCDKQPTNAIIMSCNI